jgi:phosphoglycerate dehydrogenase-like enzyme
MTKVVITEPEFRKGAQVFQNAAQFECIPAPSDEPGLAAKIREVGAAFAIIGVEKYRRELYDAIPAGGAIVRFGVGHDGVDKTLAATKGIFCCNTPGVLDDSVVELVIGLMLTTTRHIAACAADNKAGRWCPRIGNELSGKTLTIIGCGRIGRRTAVIAKQSFGMHIVGFDIVVPADIAAIDRFTQDFAAAVANADFVSIHIPDIHATRDFINADKLARMKPSAILINTARGNVLDEDALYDAIAAGALAGAALDVFKTEPYVPQRPDKDLRTLGRVLMTPHVGSSTTEACERMATAALRNIERAVSGDFGEMNHIGL